MRNHPKTLLGLAALSSVLLVGCGGGGSSSSGSANVGSANVTGGATLLTKSVTTTIPSSNAPSTHDFGGTSAVVPAGLEIPANVPVAILTGNSPVLGIQGSSAFHVNGTSTGVAITNGSLSSNVALPPTQTPYAISSPAPVNGFFVQGSRGRDLSGLTINGKFSLGVPVLSDGTAGFPKNLTGTVPTNGSNVANVAVNVFYPAAFSGYKATLTVSWTANGQPVTLAQTKTVASSGVVNFSAKSAHAIPANGVDTISLVLAPAL